MSVRWFSRRLPRTCAGRVVFLAGCGTLDVSDGHLESFATSSEATAVAGYGQSVDRLESAQMDLIVLGALAKHAPGATGVWRRAPSATLEAVYEEHAAFADRLEWGFHAENGEGWRTPRRALAEAPRTRSTRSAGSRATPASTPTLVSVRRKRFGVEGSQRVDDVHGHRSRFTRTVDLRRAAVRGLGDISGKVSVNSLRQLERRLDDVAGDPDAAAVSKAVSSALRQRPV